jgi:putative cell wall-binding protein
MWVTTADQEALMAALDDARSTFRDPNPTQPQLDAAAGRLNAALDAFEDAMQPGGLVIEPPPVYPNDEPWPRLAGSNRYETMRALISEGWKSSDTAIVATGDNFPDALAAAGLAGVLDSGVPVILTAKDRLSTEASYLLADLKVKKVYIVGGSASVSDAVSTAIARQVPSVERIAGATRVETALEIYRAGGNNWGKTAVIANGSNYADALSISPYAFAEKAPIFLSDPKTGLNAATVAAIKGGNFDKILIVGGEAAVPSVIKVQLGYAWNNTTMFSRLGGANRYETSLLIANFAIGASNALDYDNLSIASGNNFPDALAGGPLMAMKGSVLLLVADTPEGRSGINALIATHKQEIGKGYVFGGTSAISEALARDFRQASLG